jgi:DNA primase
LSSGPLDAKEQIKRVVDIVDLIGESVPLRREGRAYKGLCPWHDDSRPSLHVNPERQTFRCFVCNIGGDIFTFVEKREGVTFREALAILAERAGVTLSPGRGGTGSSGEADQRRQLLQAAAWAEQQFHECLLHASEAEPARRYLRERGITAESVARFRLGFQPNQWDWLVKRARSGSIAPAVLEKVGLVRAKAQGGGHYDFFRGRVLFSIRDLQGRPVGVGGRVLPGADSNTSKYINTPETPLFSKSRLLYGLDRAKDAITRSRTAMVMEGYTDVVIAHQCGLENAVAVLGTALGEQHIAILRRFADRVLLVLDGDDAGRRRADEILELFVSAQMDLRILTLPDDLDPADFLLARGKEPFEQLLATAVDALEHKLRIATAGLDAQSGVDQAHRAQEEMLRTLAKAPRPADTAAHLREAHILSRLSHRFRVSEVVLRDRLRALREKASKPRPVASQPSPATPPPSQPRAKPGKIGMAEQELLELVLQAPQLVGEIAQRFPPAAWSDAARRQVFTVCWRLAAQGMEPTVERLLLEIDDGQLKTLIIELDELQRRRPKPDPDRQARQLLALILEPSAVAPRILRPAPSDAITSAEDLDRVFKRAQLRHGISGPTDG